MVQWLGWTKVQLVIQDEIVRSFVQLHIWSGESSIQEGEKVETEKAMQVFARVGAVGDRRVLNGTCCARSWTPRCAKGETYTFDALGFASQGHPELLLDHINSSDLRNYHYFSLEIVDGRPKSILPGISRRVAHFVCVPKSGSTLHLSGIYIATAFPECDYGLSERRFWSASPQSNEITKPRIFFCSGCARIRLRRTPKSDTKRRTSRQVVPFFFFVFSSVFSFLCIFCMVFLRWRGGFKVPPDSEPCVFFVKLKAYAL